MLGLPRFRDRNRGLQGRIGLLMRLQPVGFRLVIIPVPKCFDLLSCPGAVRLRSDDSFGDDTVPRFCKGCMHDFDRCEHLVAEIIGLQKLEHLLHGIQFRAVGWQLDQCQVVGNNEIPGPVPSGSIQDEHCVGVGRDGLRDVLKMAVYFLSVGPVADVANRPVATGQAAPNLSSAVGV